MCVRSTKQTLKPKNLITVPSLSGPWKSGSECGEVAPLTLEIQRSIYYLGPGWSPGGENSELRIPTMQSPGENNNKPNQTPEPWF